MWLTGRLMPDFKTIANFRKDNSKATQQGRSGARGSQTFVMIRRTCCERLLS